MNFSTNKMIAKSVLALACMSVCAGSVFAKAKKTTPIDPTLAVTKLGPVVRLANKPTEGVYYSVLVRSFADGNGDGIGDFKGMTKRLDYLNDGNDATTTDLGITGLWLLPIFKSSSYHGYNVEDYYTVNEDYGTMKDFENLVSECHKRGISVIIDMTCNHSSSYNQWFIDSKNPDDPHRNWYRWITEDDLAPNGPYNEKIKIWGHNVWNMDLGNPHKNAAGKDVMSFYAAVFDTTMPDFNMDCQEVRDEFKKVFKFWMDKGVDGFRFDAAGHIYNSVEVRPGSATITKAIDFWKEMNDYITSINPNAYTVAEVWEPNGVRAQYYKGMPSNFHFDLGTLITASLNNQEINDGDPGFKPDTDESAFNGFARYLETTYDQFRQSNPDFIDAPFLTNHDQVRNACNFGNGKNKIEKQKMAADMYIMAAGVPFIYYGEEIAMRSGKDDPSKRTHLIWKPEGKDKMSTKWNSTQEEMYNRKTVPISEQEKDPDSLLNYYKRVIRVKTAHPALFKGTLKAVSCGSPVTESYIMDCPEEKAFVVHNISSKDTVVVKIPEGCDMPMVFASKDSAKSENGELTIPPYCSVVLAQNK